jgi:hypothetical protein
MQTSQKALQAASRPLEAHYAALRSGFGSTGGSVHGKPNFGVFDCHKTCTQGASLLERGCLRD